MCCEKTFRNAITKCKFWILILIVIFGIYFIISNSSKEELRVVCEVDSINGTLTFSASKGYSLMRIVEEKGGLLGKTDIPFTFKIIKKTTDLITVYYSDLKQQRERYYRFDISASKDGIFAISQFDEVLKQVAIQDFLFNPRELR